VGDDDELMEELAAAAVDEGLANALKSAQLNSSSNLPRSSVVWRPLD
jgi:hypothetical protein